MNEDYPDELFVCQACKSVKEDSTLLECFHNICVDCEQDDGVDKCNICPKKVTLPEQDQRIKHPLNEILIEVLCRPKESKQIDSKCTFCEENTDTKFCKECKTFWCENDLMRVHNKVIFMGPKHHLISANEVSLLDTAPLPEGNGVLEDDKELDELINKIQQLEEKGYTNQKKIRTDQEKVEQFRRTQEEMIDNIFDEIVEQIKHNRAKAVQNLNGKCTKMQETLENKKEENEKKLCVIRRSLKMLDKMKQHKTKSDSIKGFLTDCRFLETNLTSSPIALVHCADWNKLKNLPTKLKSDKFQANIVVDNISLEHSTVTVVPLPENPKDHNDVAITFELRSEGGKDTIKGDVNATIFANIIDTIDKNQPNQQVIHASFRYTGEPRIEKQLPPGSYHAVLEINGHTKPNPKQFQLQAKQKEFEALNPHILSLDHPGHLRAVASAGNYLYCVVKEPPEIRKYIIPNQFDAGMDHLSLEITFGQGNLATPCGICYVEEHLYVVDAGHNCIYLFTNNGDYVERIGRAGTGMGEFQRPMGIDFDQLRKDILIADTFNNRVQILNMATKDFTQFGSNEYFRLKEPVDVKACKNGNTVLTTLGGYILLYDNVRNFTTRIMTDILTPRHCCLDPVDNIYVTSHLGHSVYKLTQRFGEFVEFDRINLKTHPEFRSPTGIAISREGNLFVASRELNPESAKSFVSIW